MSTLKAQLIEFIWSAKDLESFREWLYFQNSQDFEQLIGKDEYLNLICSINEVKNTKALIAVIKANLKSTLIKEFENQFRSKQRTIKAKCISKIALDYRGSEMRNWRLQIGKFYDIIVITSQHSESENHELFVMVVNEEDGYKPEGFVPASLFEYSLEGISELYSQLQIGRNQIRIVPRAWVKENYSPVHYSFWEDFYKDDSKAVNTYFVTLAEMGLKKVW